MERPPRTWNIPSGRVSQRIQAFQDESQSSPVRSRDPRHPQTMFEPTSKTWEQIIPQSETPQLEEPELPESSDSHTPPAEKDEAHVEEGLKTETSTQEPDDRGRSAQRAPSPLPEPSNLQDVDEVLEDVRARLYSVQKIVRREQSGSSQAREDMMDELGTLLDNAIATTMTPQLIPNPLTRSASTRRPSPVKEEPQPVQLARSQSVKVASPSRPRAKSTAYSEAQSPVKQPTYPPKELPAISLPRHLFDDRVGQPRDRQASEPAAFVARRTGFPLSSPVRERALLWESMSRSSIAESDTPRSSPYTARFHPVPPPPPSVDERSRSAEPPIPLALPQIIDAERKQKQAREALLNQEIEVPVNKDGKPDLELDNTPAATPSLEWPGRLKFNEVGSSMPTVRQSTSFAEASAHDDHYSRPRPSVVKTTIRDLLSATKRKVSGKGTPANNGSKSHQPTVSESEIRQSTADLQDMDLKDIDIHLPQLKATPDEVRQIHSTDGIDSFKAEDVESAAVSYKSAKSAEPFVHKFEVPSSKRSASPVKPVQSSPVRGRLREEHSPSGRPYSIDHRFNLSPARSNSRGSRGSLTFNIKARVSPGRGIGKDDTELFVTANIESDHSDEGE